jgi:hypothetical protein
MRKHKSVVAILLAVMMIFTFMPTMAFATTETKGSYPDSAAEGGVVNYTAVWSDDFSNVTIGDRTFPTVRELDEATLVRDQTYGDVNVTSWNGKMKASIKIDASDDDYSKYSNLAPVTYYDTTFGVGAVYNMTSGEVYALPDKTINQSNFEAKYVNVTSSGYYDWMGIPTVAFKIPSYVRGYSQFSDEAKAATFEGQSDFWMTRSVELSDISSYESGKDTDQPFTVTVKMTVDPQVEEPAYITGQVPASTFVVSKYSKGPDDADFYLDSVDNPFGGIHGGFVTSIYDGATHTLVADEVPGWTLTYQVYNKTTGKYEDTTSPITISNVLIDEKGDYDPILVQVVFKKAGMRDVKKRFEVNLVPARVAFGFDPDQSVVDPSVVTETRTEYDYDYDGQVDSTVSYTTVREIVNNITYKTAEATYDAMSYVILKPVKEEITGWSYSKGQDKRKAGMKAVNAANESAVLANQAALETFKNEMFEVKETPSKADPNKISLELRQKSLTSSETKELVKKYAQLMANFDWDDDAEENPEMTATMLINQTAANTKEDDITFTTASNKTIKIKKAKKTKKAYSFAAVEASAKSGNAITYMMTAPNKKIVIDSATGKITVKKGLKKGTYKVTVKAVTDDGNGYKAAKESVKLTIKIKK